MTTTTTTATTTATPSWHYARAGQQHGPVDDATFRAMAGRGQILPTDLVWRAGMAQWAAASTIDGLFPLRVPGEPPPVPPISQTSPLRTVGYFAPPPAKPEDDPKMRLLVPVGRTPLSIAAGYLGLLSPLVIFAPFALIVSILAVRELKRKPHMHGMGRAIFGLIMGTIFTLGTLVLIALALLNP